MKLPNISRKIIEAFVKIDNCVSAISIIHADINAGMLDTTSGKARADILLTKAKILEIQIRSHTYLKDLS